VHTDWFRNEFLAAGGHPVYSAGIQVDDLFHTLGPGGAPLYANRYAAGGALGHFDPLRERSLEGVALATGFAIGNRVGQPEEQKAE
jgi:glycerol-3-phosphate dehydrogenase subunit B